jgi:tetratricopeptide (TPR) repeat protein
MIQKSNVVSAKIFQPEIARIVYECAIHLSANSKHDEAKEVANFSNDIFNLSNQQVPASSLFSHTMPLPELVRRHIQYSCNAPATSKKAECRDGVEMPIPSVTSEQLDEIRMKGNDFFKKGLYNDALKIYSDAIDKTKDTALFDVRLLSNRASVYLKLGQYDEALQDAEGYILQHPKCWRGYARKALALVELKDVQDAYVAASIAFYYKRNVFRDFEPFRKKFGCSMEMRVFVCRDTSDLSAALRSMRNSLIMRNVTTGNPEDLPVIVLENGDYLVSLHSIDSNLFKNDELLIANCILVGSDGECSVTIDDNHGVVFGLVFSAYNIHFHCRFSNCRFLRDSVVKLNHCSFTSSNDTYASFYSTGKLKIDFCKFYNCMKVGLLVESDAEITNSQFYDDAVPLEVRKGGRLIVRRSRMYGNKQGLLIGSQAKECVVEDCAFYDNGTCGITVTNCESNVVLIGSRIYDNDGSGITVVNSKVSIFQNEIRGNSDWGICIGTFGQAVVKKNKIQNNRCGGILVNTHPFIEKSVVECNHISFNSGPGIYDEGFPTQRRENKLHDNKEERNQLTAKSKAKFCYYCKKPGKNLQKCCNCFTAKYCGEECQKSDGKNHQDICDSLLADGSIVLHYFREPMMTRHLPVNEWGPPLDDFKFTLRTSERGPDLLPVGPAYCPPPNTTTMFIVKMSAGFQPGQEPNPSEVRLYDRSLAIDGKLTDAHQIYHLVWQHGAMGQLSKLWKKLFMWVKGPEHGKLRVFINEFPPYQNW